jgi:2-oxoglutarate dehydrogenase E2 component (dihydrolipoamide succinyltransferase)
VKRDEPIVELETDKVTLEVNAPSDGVISKIMVGEGQNVGVGAILGELSAANDAAKPAAAPTPAPKQEAPKAAAPAPAPAPAPAAPAPQKQEAPKQQYPANEDMKLSPAVRKMLADNNLDASQIQPSGRDGRVSKEDVEKFIAAKGSAPNPMTSPATQAPKKTAPRETGAREERVRMTKLRQVIARRLKEAQNTAAMLTTFNEADMGR